jgi:hypothetical protein
MTSRSLRILANALTFVAIAAAVFLIGNFWWSLVTAVLIAAAGVANYAEGLSRDDTKGTSDGD